MNITEFIAWVEAAPRQISRTSLRNMAYNFDFVSPRYRELVWAMKTQTEGSSMSPDVLIPPYLQDLYQSSTLCGCLRRIASDESRPEESPDPSAELEAFQRWVNEGPEWLMLLLLQVGYISTNKNALTPAQWDMATLLAQGHE